jgi:hypothetical protein
MHAAVYAASLRQEPDFCLFFVRTAVANRCNKKRWSGQSHQTGDKPSLTSHI